MNKFEYVYPKELSSIPEILSEAKGQALLYAGGTDLLSRLKEGIVKPAKLVNLKAVQELNKIEEDQNGLHVGAATPLVTIAEDKKAQRYPGLIEAVNAVATIQLRDMGTLGGNLCQRPRCWYFRSRHFMCLRKGGGPCYALFGENRFHAILGGGPCFIVYPSDTAPMLIALGATADILGPEGRRNMDLEKMYVLPEQDPRREVVLTPEQVLVGIDVPASAKSLKSRYVKFRERKSFDFATVSVAVAAQVSGKKLTDVRVVMGGVAPIPWRARQAERILEGQEITDELLKTAGEAEMEDARPLKQNEYKIALSKTLLSRAVGELVAV